MVYVGRRRCPKQNIVTLQNIIEKHESLVEELAQWDPLEFGGSIQNRKNVYTGTLTMHPPGTVFAEWFEPIKTTYNFD